MIKNCPKCGEDHINLEECPYIFAPCVICGKSTMLACSNCAIDGKSIHVCNQSSCRGIHEKAIPIKGYYDE